MLCGWCNVDRIVGNVFVVSCLSVCVVGIFVSWILKYVRFQLKPRSKTNVCCMEKTFADVLYHIPAGIIHGQ